ncbi:phosphatase PAP2 family protein [Leuconostoc lactis]|uniref:phosphatase PAP2 family protein n=1 Tax=Leuconostoc lactis TaxID=1246 RepID=UPI0006DC44B8|nr:phosphatase PAP2 family protein [Leuconostoc lactis]KQB81381.1 phospholipid phosphatase [Leuconostoc lactis]HBP98275.1 phosphatase PAP2 family protein [Leuconostoc lactis]
MLKKQNFDLFLTVFAALTFTVLLFGVLTKATWLAQLNRVGQLVIQQRSPQLTTLFMTVTQLGSIALTTGLTTLIAVILISQRQWRWASFIVINVAVFAGLITALIKNWVQNPRPQPQLLPETGYSFPSGHSMVAILLYGTLILMGQHFVQKRWCRYLIITILTLIICLIPISRVYLNVHYLSDVLAGLSLGWILLRLSYHLFFGERYATNNT